MKKTTKKGFLSRFRANSDRPVAPKRGRFEPLEARELLAVSAVEYAAIRDAYPEFDLPQAIGDLNVVEIDASELSLQALKDALETAGGTAKDDLIVVRTTAARNAVSYAKSSDQIVVDFDPEIFGSATIVALGSSPLTIDAGGVSRALTLAVGKLNLGNVALVDGTATDRGGLLYNKGSLTLKNCSFQNGSTPDGGLGGSLYSSGEILAIDSSFDRAESEFGVYSTGAAEFANCSFDSNSGAGLYAEAEAETLLRNCSVSNNPGAGIVNKYGAITLVDCVVSNNGGVGVDNAGSASITTSTLSSNGDSGLVNRSFQAGSPFSALVNVARSKIVANRAENGAGVLNLGGIATLSNCELSQNVASDSGGGLSCQFLEGYSNQTTLVNCSIAGNVAGNRGGGVLVEPSFGCAARNTIVATNFTGDLDQDVSGSVSGRNNLFGSSPRFVVAPIYDLASATLTNGDSLDLRLAANSPAINAGDSSVVGTNDLDLAGAGRLYGKSVDLGPYEYRGTGEQAPAPVYVVDTLVDSLDPTDGVTSLREALYYAEGSGATITFASNLAGTIKLRAQLVVSTPITVDGDSRIVLDAQNGSRVLLAEAATTLKGLELRNGKTAGDGALVRAQASFAAQNSSFASADAQAALYLLGASTLTNCSVSGSANDAIYSSGSLTFDSGSVAQNAGRGIVNDYGTLIVKNASVRDNGSSGVFNIGSATVLGSILENNADSAVVNQSVVVSDASVFASTLDLKNSILRGNAAERGAAVRNVFGRVEAIGSDFSANVAATDGGAIYNEVDPRGVNSIALRNCSVAGNVAGSVGGGVASESGALFAIYNSIVAMNLSGDFDSNVSGEVSVSVASQIGGNPGFVVAPLFDFQRNVLTNASALDLRLTANSPLLDAGDNSELGSGVSTDLVGAPRIWNGKVDLGAYEYSGSGETSVEPTGVVTVLDDSFNLDDGKTSLREALYWARPGQTITFAPGLAGTIKLNAQLTSTCNITIDGGDRVAISGQNKTRVLVNEAKTALLGLELTSGAADSLGSILYSSGDLTLDGTTISGGKAPEGALNGSLYSTGDLVARDSIIEGAASGVGVLAYGKLTANNCEIRDCAAGGLFVANVATLTNCSVSNNGDYGVYNLYGSLELKSSELSGNKGAGLANLGTATLTGCLVSGNKDSGLVNLSEDAESSAKYSGSLKVYVSVIKGNEAREFGGGVRNLGGALELDNCEISANSAGALGGGVFVDSVQGRANRANIVNCAIVGNRGGDRAGGVCVASDSFVLNMFNSIVAKNYSPNPNANVEGTLAESVRNLTSGNPAFVVGPIFSDDGVLTNPDDLDLRPTRDSVVVDFGDNDRAVGNVDLLGNPRIFNGTVDLGPYEFVAVGSTLVTTLVDSFEFNDDETSLREALYFAKDGDLVSFESSINGTIALDSTLEINSDVAVVGFGRIALDGKGAVRILVNNASASISGLTFQNGLADGDGGALLNFGDLTLENCSFSANRATNGGAIASAASATTAIVESTFLDNSATVLGGALYNAGDLRATSARFARNAAGESGGSLYGLGKVLLVNSALVDSTAGVSGGGIAQALGEITLVNCSIAGNDAPSGGGLDLSSCSATLFNNVIALNSEDVAISESTTYVDRVLSSYEFDDDETTNYLFDPTKPLFVNATAGNYRLADGSQAVDKASTERAREFELTTWARDLAGSARYIGNSLDLGAYESATVVDSIVSENCDLEFRVDARESDKIYWDLSGTGTGDFVETSPDFWRSPLELGLEPGVATYRAKVVDSSGAVVAERSLVVQETRVLPLVNAEILPTPFDDAIVLSVDARFLGTIPDRSWRVDWGDGTSDVVVEDSFVVGKFYDASRLGAREIDLVLVGADGRDEWTYQIGLFDPTENGASSAELDENGAIDLLASAIVEETASAEPKALFEEPEDARAVVFATFATERDPFSIDALKKKEKRSALDFAWEEE